LTDVADRLIMSLFSVSYGGFKMLGRLPTLSISRALVSAVAGAVVLSIPTTGAIANAQPAWRYVVKTVSGSATWEYDSAAGTGVDSVVFGADRGSHASGDASSLRGEARYTDANSTGCGSTSKTGRLGSGGGLTFVVLQPQKESPYVRVTWGSLFPHEFRCYRAGALAGVTKELKRLGLFSKDVPLSRFSCGLVLLNFAGRAKLSEGATRGTFAFHLNVVLQRH
jgi:hypothetical protein